MASTLEVRSTLARGVSSRAFRGQLDPHSAGRRHSHTEETTSSLLCFHAYVTKLLQQIQTSKLNRDGNQQKVASSAHNHKLTTVNVGYNDAGRNDNLDITTENAGTGFAALETQWL